MARLFSVRKLVFGGLAIGAAYALKNKQAVGGLLGGGGDAATPSAPPTPYATPAPAVANADVAGPPANTSTHVPAPEPQVHDPSGGIDEAAEEAAAAAEAANIGGVPEEYPSEEDASVETDEALRPVEEAGGGYAEGQELAEADLIDNAEVAAGDPVDGERAIDDVIEAQDDPLSGETLDEASPESDVEPLPADEAEEAEPGATAAPDEPTMLLPLDEAPAPTGPPAADVPPPPDAAPISTETPAGQKSAAVWDTPEKAADEDDERA